MISFSALRYLVEIIVNCQPIICTIKSFIGSGTTDCLYERHESIVDYDQNFLVCCVLRY